MRKCVNIAFLVLCMFSFTAIHAETKLVNLRVEYMTNPIGIDVVSPQFSWEMQSSRKGMKQTAYEISLLNSQNEINWSTGVVSNDKSVGIVCENISLQSSTRYNWQVSVWDQNGTKITSEEEAFFETGLLDAGWSGAVWLQHKEKNWAEQPVTFTFSCDVTVLNQNAGIIFGATDIHNMHIWAINTYGTANNQPALRRHIFKDGHVHYTEDVPLPYTTEQIIGHERQLTIDVVDKLIYTYLDGNLVDSYYSSDLQQAYVGFRVYTGDNNTREHAYIDNVVYSYIDEQGNVHELTEDFENNSNDFEGTHVVDVNGNFKMNLTAPGNEDFRVLQSASHGIPMFRTQFELTKTVKSARLYSSALGVYNLFMNGDRVGVTQADGSVVYDELKPGWTDYRKTIFYTTYDVSDLLRVGENVVAAEVSSGWFMGKIAHNEYGSHSLGFLAKLLIEYEDGSVETFVTNTNTWKSSKNSAIRLGDIYDGESYDARKESDWTKADFDDSQWEYPEKNNYFKGEIIAYIGEPVRIRHDLDLSPQSIYIYDKINDNSQTFGEVNIVGSFKNPQFALKKGETAIIDFGQNFVGWIKFKVKGSSGSRITVRFAEMLNDSGSEGRGNDDAKGTLYLRNLRSAKAVLNYTLKEEKEGESYRPSSTFYGFRYCEITATDDIVLEELVGEVVGNINEERSSFTTNNELVNQLYSNVIWGQRGNFLSVPTDCPQRDERLGWMGDTQVFSRAAAYNADVVSFFKKWAKDVRDSQQRDGTYPSVVPDNWNVGYGRTAWAEAAIIVPWNIYLMYGDKRMLQEHYASMEKFMVWLATRQFDGYLYNGGDTQYGDWLAYEHTDPRFISVSYYAYVAKLMTKISEALSESENDSYAQKADQYSELYTNIKKEFQRRYVNSRNGNLHVTSQTAYLLTLQNDLFPDEKGTENGLLQLENKIRNNGNKLSTGFVGTATLNQTLSAYGADEVAYNLLLQRNNPSWLYSIDQGATTIWERWNSYTIDDGFGDPGMNSFNHYAYGAVSEWMYRYMAGIETDENNPAFKHIILQPRLDLRDVPESDLITMVNASFGSYYGQIKSKWERLSSKNYRFTVTIPANTTATMYIPRLDNNTALYNNEIKAENVEGVVSFVMDDEQYILELESGTYIFETKETSGLGSQNQSNTFLDIYPNPINKGERLFVNTNNNSSFKQYKLYSAVGDLITNHVASEPLTSFTMTASSGVYLLKIYSDEEKHFQTKIIVQ